MESRVSTLILSDGGLGSLVACAAAREATLTKDGANAGDAVVVAFQLSDVAGEPLGWKESAESHAAHYGFSFAETVGETGTGSKRSAGEHELRLLVRAAFFAAESGIARVLWPVTACMGESYDLDAIAKVTERAIVVSKLVALEAESHGVPGITIETPFLDMTDRQLADLAVDLGVPVELCWWWNANSESTERRRWMQAMEAVGGLREAQ